MRDDFSTIKILIDNIELSIDDKYILEEIMHNNDKINDLILSHSHVVDNNLREELSKLSSHYTILKLVKEGRIKENSNRYKDLHHSKEIDDILKKILIKSIKK